MPINSQLSQTADKASMRELYMEKRQALSADKDCKKALDNEIQARLLVSPEYRAADTVLLYMARPYEISASLILFAALANNKTVGLPVCVDKTHMIFRRVSSLSDVEVGKYGILTPKSYCKEINDFDKTLCVCPALCCDMQGYRLGFGAGYYDRFLSDFSGKKAALCYSDSLIPNIENNGYDIPVDIIFTDSFTRYI